MKAQQPAPHKEKPLKNSTKKSLIGQVIVMPRANVAEVNKALNLHGPIDNLRNY